MSDKKTPEPKPEKPRVFHAVMSFLAAAMLLATALLTDSEYYFIYFVLAAGAAVLGIYNIVMKVQDK